jgi:SAM-dependent methyltransferase
VTERPPSLDLSRLYGARDLDELRTEYDRVASVYDGDDWDWLGPEMVVEVVQRWVARDSLILDAGAGTGQLGVELRDAGYARIDAMDLSAGMLGVAREKGAYSDLREGRLGDPLDYEDGAYAAVVASGVFTTGHAPPEGLRELVRITRAGGHVIFTLRSDATPPGFAELTAQLDEEGVWALAECGSEVAAMPKTAPEVLLRVWVYAVF